LHRHFLYDRLVLRSIRIPHEQYLAHLKNDANIDEKWLGQITGHVLKRSLWMVEIGCYELFGITRKKFGEILLRDTNILTDAENKLNEVFLMARLPQMVFIDFSGKPSYEINVDSYTPLFDMGQYR
jgi:hypothetical protein